MRWRAALLALLASGIAGCFGQGSPDDGLAKPTDQPVVSPTPPPSPTRAVPTPNLTDPGYVADAAWHVGDAWDYVAPSSHVHTIRVVDSAQEGNVTSFLTRETDGVLGSSPDSVYARWIDASNWTVVNLTAERGLHTVYSPRLPERVLRNASYRFNATLPGETDQFFANALYTGRPTVTLPWGEIVRAARFEHRIVKVLPDRSQQRILQVHVFAAEYGNDLSYQLAEGEETFSLSAVRYGVKEHGTLLPG